MAIPEQGTRNALALAQRGGQPLAVKLRRLWIPVSLWNFFLIDDDQATITVTDSNQNTVTLDSNGITLERGSSSLVVSDSEVNINDGNLEVSA